MPNDHSSEDPGADASRGRDPIAVSEAELEGVLDKATAQLEELTIQVGPPEKHSSLPQESETSSLLTKPVIDVDRHLGEIDTLLSTAEAELGGDSPASSARKPSTTTAAAGSDAVPDFMSEFTTAAVSNPSVPAARTNRDSQLISGAVVESNLPRQNSPSAVTPPASTPSAPTGKSPVGNSVAFVLETLDRPVRNVHPAVKSLLGWVALLMFAAALIVTILSIL